MGIILPLLAAEGAISKVSAARAPYLVERELRVVSTPIETSYIPRGAQRVRMLRLRLTASCDSSVRVWSINTKKIGLGNARYIRGVYLLDGNRRLSRPTRISGDDDIANVRTLRLEVPACGTKIVDVAVDYSASTPVGSEYHFRVESAQDIVSNADEIQGQFPMINIPRTEITPDDSGSVSVKFIDPGNISVLKNDTLARFQITAEGRYYYLIQSITLTNAGSARDDDLRRLYITRNNGRQLTQMLKMLDDDRAEFSFPSPVFLPKGKTLTFELRGIPYTSSETVNFELEEESDLRVDRSRRSGRRYR